VTWVEGSTIGDPQCAHFSAAVRPPSVVAISAQFAQQYNSPRFSTIVV
jgi:hypothetical protein